MDRSIKLVASLLSLLILFGCKKTQSPTVIYSTPPGAVVVAPVAPPVVANLSTAAATIPAPVWPRTYEKNGDTVVMYQPQIDSWKDHTKIRFRAAVAVTQAGSAKTDYGVVA